MPSTPSIPRTKPTGSIMLQTFGLVVVPAASLVASIASIATSKADSSWLTAAIWILVPLATGRLVYSPALDLVYQVRYRRCIRNSPWMKELGLAGAKDNFGPALSIDDIYIDVELRPRDPRTEPPRGYEMWEDRVGKRSKIEAFLQHRRKSVFVVAGLPGAGKTTLLRATARRFARWWRPWDPVPVVVALARKALTESGDGGVALAEAAMREPWLENRGIPLERLDRWLRRRRCLVMLDGLDEVPKDQRAKVSALVTAIRHYRRRHHLLITSRPNGLDAVSFDGQAFYLDVCPLTTPQILHFINRCVDLATADSDYRRPAPERSGHDLPVRLAAKPTLLELARTPLLLHVIVYIDLYTDIGLPASRAELYQEIVETLVHRRRAASPTARPVSDLDLAAKLQIAKDLAYRTMLDQQRIFNPIPILVKILSASGLPTDAELVKADLEDNGLLAKYDGDSYMFTHWSFQEYLTALHLHETGRASRLIDSVGDDWWRGTILFWAAMHDPSPVIGECLRQDAWELAIECQNEAEARGGEIEISLMRRIDQFMQTDHPAGSRDHQLVCTEIIRRNLQQVYLPHSDKDLMVCSEPVRTDLYNLFRKDQDHKKRIATAHATGHSRLLLGLWPGEVRDFVTWLNDFEHHGYGYRLPRATELPDFALPTEVAADRHSVWARDGDHIRPQSSKHTDHGFRATKELILRCLGDDWAFLNRQFKSGGPATASAQIQLVSRSLRDLHRTVEHADSTARQMTADGDNPQLTEAIRRQQQHTGRLMELVEAIGEGNSEFDLLRSFALLERHGSGYDPRPYPRLDDFHIRQARQAVDSAKQALLQTLTWSYKQRRRLFKPRDDVPDFLQTAGAMLLAPRVDLRGRPLPTAAGTSAPLRRNAPDPTRFKAILPNDLPRHFKDALQQLPQRLDRRMRRYPPCQHLESLITEAVNSVMPMLRRETELDAHLLASVRIAFYAALVHLTEPEHPEQQDPYWACITGLAVVEARANGNISPNEALVLIRSDNY